MLRKKVIVRDPLGIHTRPAAMIVEACRGIDCKITISKGSNNANGFSILEIILLTADFGSEIEIVTDGPEEKLTMEKVAALFDYACVIPEEPENKTNLLPALERAAA